MPFLLNISVRQKLGLAMGLAFLLLAGLVAFVQHGAGLVAQRDAAQQRAAAVGASIKTVTLGIARAKTAAREQALSQRAADVNAATAAVREGLAAAKAALEEARRDAVAPELQDAIDTLSAEVERFAAASERLGEQRLAMIAQRDERFFPRSFEYDRAFETANALLEFELQGEQFSDVRSRFGAFNTAMGDLRIGVQRFLATGDPEVVPRIRRATSQAALQLRGTLSRIPDARVRDGVGRISEASGSLTEASRAIVELTQQMNEFIAGTVQPASASLQSALDAVQERVAAMIAADREAAATEVRSMASRSLIIGAGTALMLLLSAVFVAVTVGAPLRRLAGVIGAIAEGRADVQVPDRGRSDEIGAIANALDGLRGAVGRAFARGQMLDQMPLGIILADPPSGFRATYLNDAVRAQLGALAAHLPVPPEACEGAEVQLLHPGLENLIDVLAEPARLPHRVRMRIGPEMIDVTASAIRDTTGGYAGAMLAWQVSTEKARMADSFEADIGAVIETVANAAGAMREAAGTLAAGAETSVQEAQAVSQAAAMASTEVQSVAAAAEELASSVAEITRSIAEAAGAATQAVVEVRAADATVHSLSEAAARIGSVVRLISDIAGRTNLLALNATIEAARAGAAGKGFAVVAGEVKTLAAQTARATEEISRQIQEMQQVTQRSVAAIRGIGVSVERSNEIATAIAAAVEEQGATTAEIARSASQVAASADTVTHRIEGVRHGAQDTGRAASSVSVSSESVASQAALLRGKAVDFLAAIRAA